MLLGMMIRPSVQPAGENRQQESAGWPAARANNPKLAFSGLRESAAGRTCSLLRFQRHLLAVCRLFRFGGGLFMVIRRGGGSDYFALSHKLFRRFSARDLLLLSAVCGVARWGLMGWSTELPWLIVVQILHCGTFTVCHGGDALHCGTPWQ